MIDIDTVVGTGFKATCSRDELTARLATVGRALSSRSSVQVLAGILIRAEAGRLHLAATDMELSLRTSLPAEVEEEGAAVVPGRILVELARLLPAAEVSLEYRPEENALAIRSGTASYRVHTYSAEDFPRLPETVGAPTFRLAAGPLLETISRVRRSASRDDSRPVLTGVLVRFEPGKVIMAATDSYRLSVKETAIDTETPEIEAIVPARALDELQRLAAGAETVELALHGNHVVAEVGDVLLTTRRIDGQFPNYRQLLPEKFEVELTLPRTELLEVVRRAGVMAQRNAPLRLRFADGELTISAQSQDVGEARETLPVAFSGEPLEIGFNAEFLRDGIESVSGDGLRLKLISSLRPGLIQDAGGDFWYLIMPIRLAG
jgi:DNA polymerase-3 subunit beta